MTRADVTGARQGDDLGMARANDLLARADALLVDLDGTLVDSTVPVRRVWREFAQTCLWSGEPLEPRSGSFRFIRTRSTSSAFRQF